MHNNRIVASATGHAGASSDHGRKRLVAEQVGQKFVWSLDGIYLVYLRAADA